MAKPEIAQGGSARRIKDVIGFESRYAVTDDGRVWSKCSNRWLTPSYNHSGYVKVGLMDDDGKRRKLFVHRLACEAFHGHVTIYTVLGATERGSA